MRLFIAFHLAIPVINKIERFLSPLRLQYRQIKWVKTENLHITLKFLGETENTLLEDIISSLHTVNHGSFHLKVRGTGGFPNLKHPKVLWIGLQGDFNSVLTLFQQVESKMADLKFPLEQRNFSPHLTIARVKGNMPENLRQYILENRDSQLGDCQITSYSLMESKLTPKGAVYKEIEHFPLA